MNPEAEKIFLNPYQYLKLNINQNHKPYLPDHMWLKMLDHFIDCHQRDCKFKDNLEIKHSIEFFNTTKIKTIYYFLKTFNFKIVIRDNRLEVFFFCYYTLFYVCV